MPSAIHNVVVELIGAHPEALAYLLTLQGSPLQGVLHPTVDTRTKTITFETRVDAAFLLGPRNKPTSFLFAEVQLRVDRHKAFSWALYMEIGRSQYKCEGGLVVLTTSEQVRRWIANVVAQKTGAHGTVRQLIPTVIALDLIPVEHLLRADMPYLAQLAVAAHATSGTVEEVAEKAVQITMSKLPSDLAAEQLDAILGMVNVALRERLERQVMEHREYRSDFFRKIFEKGSAEGMALGEALGEARGKAEAVLAVLSARGLSISAAIRKQILGCTNVRTLDAWLRRAAVATAAEAVVKSPARPRAPSRRKASVSPGRATSGAAKRAKAAKAPRTTSPKSHGAASK